MKMKACVFRGNNTMKVEEIDVPKPGPGQALVHVKACGICGSDTHLYNGKMHFDVTGYSIFGHEFTGVVAEAGEGLQNYKVGDRVAINPNLLCGKCYFCQRGQENYCLHRQVLGGDLYGGFAEYCVCEEKLLYHLPEEVSFVEGALAEPLSCCVNGIQILDVRNGDTVLVIGAGGIGAFMIQLARINGAGTIIVSEPNDRRRELAVKYGATILVDPNKETIEEVCEKNHIRNIDKVIECVGAKQTITTAYNIIGKGCTIMIFGTPARDEEIPIHPWRIFENELKITATYINPYTFGRVLELMKARRIDLSEHVKTLLPLENIMNFFETDKYKDASKVIVVP